MSELITPTQTFSNQQEELLDGLSGGGDKMRGGDNSLRRENALGVFMFSIPAFNTLL